MSNLIYEYWYLFLIVIVTSALMAFADGDDYGG